MAGFVALPASTATRGEAPPIVTGPLVARGTDCHAAPSGNSQHCAYLYLLDPKATTAPGRAWRAYWITDRSGVPTPTGSCTAVVVDALEWGTGRRPGPAPGRTYPPAGSSSVTPNMVAHLIVDAAGHATKRASLAQRSHWTPGTITATAQRGRLVVLWEGRTTGVVPFTLAAEIADPVGEFGLVGATNFQLSAPCTRVPPPGRDFLAQITPASVAPGQTAWLQLRIPGILPRLIVGRNSYAWTAANATVTVSKESVPVFGPESLKTVGGRFVLPLDFAAGSYDVAVTLQGPTGTRHYLLPFRVG